MSKLLIAIALLCVVAIVVSVAVSLAQTPGSLGGPPQEVMNQGVSTAAVTPTDNTLLPNGTTRSLFNGNATVCTIAVKLFRDTSAVTFNNVQPGQFLPLRAAVVMNTGTSCTNIVALY